MAQEMSMMPLGPFFIVFPCPCCCHPLIPVVPLVTPSSSSLYPPHSFPLHLVLIILIILIHPLSHPSSFFVVTWSSSPLSHHHL